MLEAPAAQIAVSALKAFEKKADVTANNIANIDTDEFKASRALFQTGEVPGVSVTITEENTPGTTQPDGAESSNVNLPVELVNLITTQHAQSANIKVIETDEQMKRSLIDVFA